jgi:ABC-type uncharacterized transport system involved in gliding motility auxiliary subunit
MEMSDKNLESFSVKYRWIGWINLWCAVLAVTVLAIAFNCFSHRHYQRKSWANNLNRELSSRTQQLLDDMTNRVDIIIFYDRQETTYRMVEELLQKYAYRNSDVHISSVDPIQQPKEARHIQSKFRLSEQQNNLVIFASENQHKIVSNGQLSQMTPRHVSAEELQSITEQKAPEEGGFVMERTAFFGERLFTSALLSVSSQKQPLVYCLTGHGEHSITNLNSSGFGEFGQLLGEMNVRVGDLALQKETKVPLDCKLLIIPGPKIEINLEEQHHINRYLERGGRLMILLNHRSTGGLSDLLRFWGILVGNNTVLDSDNTLGDGSITLRHYVHHPVVQTLQREDLPVRLLLPRTVSLLPDTDPIAAKQKMHALIQTGPKGKAYRNFLNSNTDNKPALESQGSLSIAAAVERDTLVGVKTDHLARIVVIGDSLFLSNQMIDKEGNRELAWHTVNWLLDRSNLMQGIGPQPIQTYRFEFKSDEFRNLAIFLVGIMPGGTLAFGILIWLRRRT